MKKTLIGAAAVALGLASALAFVSPASAETVVDGWTAGDNVEVTSTKIVMSEGGYLTKEVAGNASAASAVEFTITVSGAGACGAGAPRLTVAGKIHGHLLPCVGGTEYTVDSLDDLTWYDKGGNTNYGTWANALAALGEDKSLGRVSLIFDNNPGRTATVKNLTLFGDAIALLQPEPEVKACEAYNYVGTTENLCADFPALDASPTCPDVKYQVTVLNPSVDPWGLDDGGTDGIGCEANPVKGATPTPTPTVTPTGVPTATPTATPTAEPTATPTATTQPTTAAPVPTDTESTESQNAGLPVTGPSGGTNVPLIGALAGIALLAIGAALFVWARRRNTVAFTA